MANSKSKRKAGRERLGAGQHQGLEPDCSELVVLSSTKKRGHAIAPGGPFSLSLSLPVRTIQNTGLPVLTETIQLGMATSRIFIASIGNPGTLAQTRHSAGHVLLRALQAGMKLPELKKQPKEFAKGWVSNGAKVGQPELMLWQSPSLMNVSGISLVRAYKQFAASSGQGSDLPGLMVLHDDMQVNPGNFRLRRGATSARGHNGIKSIQDCLQSSGLLTRLTETGDGGRYVKVAVGIGRPPAGSKEPKVVSEFVLGELTALEMDNIEGCAEGVIDHIRQEMDMMSSGTA
ncbi:peptidyl-tRNA hydrolase [Xylariales sp. PMI_506]|nr:peptidyl-tRNA hydrolase [Xylariales sp. PMI_506]